MMQAYGLYSHIQANRIKSLILLAGFVVLLQALLFSFGLLIAAFTGGGDVGEIFARAFRQLSVTWPLGMIGAAVWFVIAFLFHRSMIAFATRARPVERQAAPALYAALEELCISRGITMPKLQIIETPGLNAFASGLRPSDYAITVTRGLLDSLNKRELQAVLAHELTHIRNKDTQLLVIAVIFAGIFAFFSDISFRGLDFPFGYSPHAPSSSRAKDSDDKNGAAIIVVVIIALAIIAISWGLSVLIRLALSRSREFLADAGSVELTKDPDAMISALQRISGQAAIPDMPSRMHAFFIETPAVRAVSSLFATHPPIEERIAALVRYGGGREV